MPRVEYERTYVLLPPSAGAEWANAVIAATWNDKRYTIGSSADDAGIGDLQVRKVIAVNPQEWPGDLAEFFDEYYPGVSYAIVEAATPGELQAKLSPKSGILLSQCDPRWANVKIAETYCTKTICQIGCWITNCAMAQRYLGIDPNATPETANALLGPTGFSGCECKWSAMERLGLKVIKKTYDHREAIAHLSSGHVCFAEVQPTSLLHFVMVTKHLDGRYWMYDPWKNYEGWLDEKYIGVESWRLIGRTAPSPPPLPPAIKFPLRGVHDEDGARWLAQENLAGWCNISAEIGTHARNFNLHEYPDNIRFILNLRFSYATDDGGAGTMPAPSELKAFEEACLGTMRLNPEAWAFSICNEFNNVREHPRGFTLTPDYYLTFYNSVWLQAPNARIMPGAIDPYNAGWNDWRIAWRYVLDRIIGAVGLTFHAYTHSPDLARIRSVEEFSHAPLLGVYYDMRVLESQQAIVPEKFRHLPQIVTETNHWVKYNEEIGWEPDAGHWVTEAYDYFRSRGVLGACLFRHGYIDWRYGDKPDILNALKGVE